jgi:cytochrome c oxidase subunit 2
MFGWATKLYFSIVDPPANAAPIYVVGKQWMWKIQHPEGNREIDELHVPLGRPVKLLLTSEDVIHDFFVPAFRVKKDVLPGTYTTLWFEPTKVGRYHFFCSQYCGTNHASMRGWVYVMDPADYQNWLAGGTSGQTMAQAGAKLFDRYNCVTCHKKGGRGPLLQGVYGSKVHLTGGGTVTADDAYLRESILTPQAKLVQGYGPIMPTFQGQLTEMNVLQLIAYIKTLSEAPTGATVAKGK